MLLLHCGGKPASYEDVCAVPLPKRTATYTPVAYGQIIDHVRNKLVNEMGLTLHNEAYGLSKGGNRLFGVLSTRTHDDHGLAIGLRSSNDGSASLLGGIGDKVFVCDNMQFCASGVVVMRTHRGDAWMEFRRLIDRQLSRALETHASLTLEIDRMKQHEISQDDGYGLLGLARGHNVVTPTQYSSSLQDWDKPRHDVPTFTARTIYALYQCVTESLKRTPVRDAIDRHCDAHSFFRKLSTDVIDA